MWQSMGGSPRLDGSCRSGLAMGFGVKTKLLAAAMAASVFGLAGAGTAVAATTVSYTPYGTPGASDSPIFVFAPTEPTPGGEDVGTAQSDGTVQVLSPFALLGSAEVVQGQYSYSAEPQLTASMKDAAPYLSILGGQLGLLASPGVTELEFYIGSLDSYNSVSFVYANPLDDVTFGGNALVAATAGSGSQDNGDQSSGATNGLYTFNLDPGLEDIFLTSTNNSFEIANIYAPSSEITGTPIPFGTPEPATWLMMVLGVAAIGAGLRMERSRQLAEA
jgi:hypothetical protein